METSLDACVTTGVAIWDLGGVLTVRAIRIVCALLNGASLVRLSFRGLPFLSSISPGLSVLRMEVGHRHGTVSESCLPGLIVSCGFGIRLPSFGRCLLWYFRRELVRLSVPIILVSFSLGTRPSSDSYGIGRDNIAVPCKFVVPALA